MNSSIQCLSNTVPLASHFITGTYEEEINEDNPLGQGGQLAREWYSLMEKIWSGKHSSIAPRDFKFRLAKFAPQFEGYQQHDSQELLSFLLDGIHEDLNRVKQKPYVETQDSDGRPDELVAQEHWANYKARNDSIIVDWFQGQLKSTLVCPDCDRISVTFDPFMYLSLPLPTKTTRSVVVTLFPADPAKLPQKVRVSVGKMASIKKLVETAAEAFDGDF